MTTQPYPITGIVPDNKTNPPPRRDIEKWYKESRDDGKSEAAMQVSLFIQALEQFQQKGFTHSDPNAKLSYYRVASMLSQHPKNAESDERLRYPWPPSGRVGRRRRWGNETTVLLRA